MSWPALFPFQTDRPYLIGNNDLVMQHFNDSLMAAGPSVSQLVFTIDHSSVDETDSFSFEFSTETGIETLSFDIVASGAVLDDLEIDKPTGGTIESWRDTLMGLLTTLPVLSDEYVISDEISGTDIIITLETKTEKDDDMVFTGSTNVTQTSYSEGVGLVTQENLQVLLKVYIEESISGNRTLERLIHQEYITPKHNINTILTVSIAPLYALLQRVNHPTEPPLPTAFGIYQMPDWIIPFSYSLQSVYGNEPVEYRMDRFQGLQAMAGGYTTEAELDHFEEVIAGQTYPSMRDEPWQVVRGFGAYLPVYIHFESATTLTVEIVSHSSAGSQTDSYPLGEFTQFMGSLGVGPDQLLVPLTVSSEDVTHYTVSIKEGVNVVTVPRTFDIIPHEVQFRNLCYRNCYGQFETILLKGFPKTSVQPSGEIYNTINDGRILSNRLLDEEMLVSTGAVTFKDWRALRDLYLSDKLYLQSNGKWIPFALDPDDFDGPQQDVHIHHHTFTLRPNKPYDLNRDEYSDLWNQSAL